MKIMTKILVCFTMLMVTVACRAFNPIVGSGWTTTSDAGAARTALGLDNTVTNWVPTNGPTYFDSSTKTLLYSILTGGSSSASLTNNDTRALNFTNSYNLYAGRINYPYAPGYGQNSLVDTNSPEAMPRLNYPDGSVLSDFYSIVVGPITNWYAESYWPGSANLSYSQGTNYFPSYLATISHGAFMDLTGATPIFTGNMVGNVTGGLTGNATSASKLIDQLGNDFVTADPLKRGWIYNPGTSNAVAVLTSITTNWYGKFNGDGSALTSLNASNLSTGTVSDSRLSSNVALLNGSQTWSGSQVFTNGIVLELSKNAVAAGGHLNYNHLIIGSGWASSTEFVADSGISATDPLFTTITAKSYITATNGINSYNGMTNSSTTAPITSAGGFDGSGTGSISNVVNITGTGTGTLSGFANVISQSSIAGSPTSTNLVAVVATPTATNTIGVPIGSVGGGSSLGIYVPINNYNMTPGTVAIPRYFSFGYAANGSSLATGNQIHIPVTGTATNLYLTFLFNVAPTNTLGWIIGTNGVASSMFVQTVGDGVTTLFDVSNTVASFPVTPSMKLNLFNTNSTANNSSIINYHGGFIIK